MKNLGEQVKEMFRELPDSEQKRNVMMEVTEMLHDKVQDLMKQGKTEEEAIRCAITDFGDVTEMKQELAGYKDLVKIRVTWLNFIFALVGSGLIISIVGFTNLYFSSGVIWFPYVAFAVLWWPLIRWYQWLNAK